MSDGEAIIGLIPTVVAVGVISHMVNGKRVTHKKGKPCKICDRKKSKHQKKHNSKLHKLS